MWFPLLALLVGILAIAWIAMATYGAHRWQQGTAALRARLEATRVAILPARVDFADLLGLPAPVARYLRTVLREGQPLVAAVDFAHDGTFDMGETTVQWKAFTSTQRVVTQRPGFDWDGRIAMFPGVPARVHDAYVAGEGILIAAVFGLLTVADQRGGRALAEGELMRYLAEAAWYPTALLPSQGVRWEAVDANSARATLRDGAIAATLLFEFGADGLVAGVSSPARGRMVGGTVVPTPWRGRFWSYAEREGLRVPLEGEVAWVLPDGPKPYWRGRLRTVTYESAADS